MFVTTNKLLVLEIGKPDTCTKSCEYQKFVRDVDLVNFNSNAIVINSIL